MACDMPKTCRFSSLDRCQWSFLCSHKGDNLAPLEVVGLVVQIGDAEKFPQAFGFESLGLFFSGSASMVHVFQPWR